MTTIRILSERILRILSGGNVSRDSKYNERDIQYLVRDVCSELIKGTYFEDRQMGERNIDSRFVVTFGSIEVKDDSGTGEEYAEIPVDSYLRIGKDAGIRSVRPDFSQSETKKTKIFEVDAFIPIPNRFKDIYAQLPAGALEQEIGYEIRKDRIYFTKYGGTKIKSLGITKVIMDIATVDPAAVDVDDAVPLPNEYTSQLITKVLQLLGVNVTPDVINDNNPIVTKVE